MASGPITSWQVEWGFKRWKQRDFLFLGSKMTVDGDCSMKLEDDCFLSGKL